MILRSDDRMIRTAVERSTVPVFTTPAWKLAAPCVDHFHLFDEAGQPGQTCRSEAVLEAKAVCGACPYIGACLDDAFATEHVKLKHRWGVRAGLTPREREQAWQERQVAS